MRAKLVLILSFVSFSIVYGQSVEDLNLPADYKVIDIPDSRFIHFVKEGKMGILKPNNDLNSWIEILPATYDFIIPVPDFEGVVTLKDGKFSALGIDGLSPIFNDVTGVVELTELGDGAGRLIILNNVSALRKDYEAITGWTKIPMDKVYRNNEQLYLELVESSKLLIRYNSVDQYGYRVAMKSWDYPGEDSISDDGNVVYYPRQGEEFSGIFDLEIGDWVFKPELRVIEMDRGYFCWKAPYEKNNETRKMDIDFYDRNFMLQIDAAEYENYSDQDWMKLLPAGSEIIRYPNEYGLYYRLNNKVGVFDFRPDWGLDCDPVDPKYDFVIGWAELNVFITVNDGKFELLKGNIRYDDHLLLPYKVSSSIEFFNTGGYDSYALVDDKQLYQLTGNGDDEPLKWSKVSEVEGGDKSEKLENISVHKVDKKTLLVNFDNEEEPYALMSVWYPGEDSIDAEGNVVYGYSGVKQSRFYDLEKRDWASDPYYSLVKVPEGYIVSDEERLNAWDSRMSVGLLDNDLQEVIPQMYRSLVLIDDVFIATTDSTALAFDRSGKVLIEEGNYGHLNFKDGFFFAPGASLYDEYGDPAFDENGEYVVTKELLVNKLGEPLKIGYEGYELWDDGILMIRSNWSPEGREELIGFYDLKNKKLLAEPAYKPYKRSIDKPGVYWLQKDGKWSRYQVGRGFGNIGNEEYDNLEELSFYVKGLIKCEKDGKFGLIDEDGKITLAVDYTFGYARRIVSGNIRIMRIQSNEKVGLFDLSNRKMMLEPIYDDIVLHDKGSIAVKENGKWGVIEEESIKEDGSFEWRLPTKFEGKLFSYHGHYAMDSKEKYGLVDQAGRVLIPPKYDNLWSADSKIGLYPEYDTTYVIVNGKDETQKCGLYTGDKMILPMEYAFIDFQAGQHMLLLKTEGEGTEVDSSWGFYDLFTQSITIPCEYQELTSAYVKEDWVWLLKDGKYGVYSTDGTVIIDHTFTQILNHFDDTPVWSVRTAEGEGIVDVSTNEYWVKPKYDKVEVQDNLILSWKGKFLDLYVMEEEQVELVAADVSLVQSLDGAVLYDQEGEIYLLFTGGTDDKHQVVSCVYDEIHLAADEAEERVYIVKKDGKSGLINAQGEAIFEIKYDVLEYLTESHFIVGFRNEWAYLDQSPTVGIMNISGELIEPIEYQVFHDDIIRWHFVKEGKYYSWDGWNRLRIIDSPEYDEY